MNWYKGVGNGKGTCPVCGKPILSGEHQFVIEGYKYGARIHVKCIVDMPVRPKIIKRRTV